MSAQTTQDFSGMLAQLPGYLPELPAWICDEEGHLLQSNSNSSGGPESAFFEGLLLRFKDFFVDSVKQEAEFEIPPGIELGNKRKAVISCRKLRFQNRDYLVFQMKKGDQQSETDWQTGQMADEFGIYAWSYDAGTQSLRLGKGADQLLGIFGSRLPLEDFLAQLSPESLSRFTASIENALNFGKDFRIELLLETGHDFRWLLVSGRPHQQEDGPGIAGLIKDLSKEKAEKQKLTQLEGWVNAGLNRLLVTDSAGEIVADLGSPAGKQVLEQSAGKRKVRLVDFRNQVKYVVEAETGTGAETTVSAGITIEKTVQGSVVEGLDEKLGLEEKFVSLSRALGLRTDAQVSALGVFDGSRFEWKAWWKSPSAYAVPSSKYSGEWLPDLSWLLEMEAENQKFSDRYWWPQDMLPFPISDSFGKGWMLLTEKLSPGQTGLVALRTKEPEALMDRKEEVLNLLRFLRDDPEKPMPDESVEKLKEEIVRREMLLKELNHRAKNNLALAAGMIKMQAGFSEDKKTAQFLRQTQKRLETLATLHELMYMGPSREGSVEIQSYLHELLQGLHAGFGNPGISLEMQIDEASIHIRYANTIGLLVNEVVSNAYKHAFSDEKPGNLKVDFLSKGDYFKLRISDNGPGFEEENKDGNSLGNILIDEFVKQLGATMEISRNPGTTYLISIKKSNIGL